MLDQKTLDRLVSFRKQLHTYPEIGFEEFETRKRIKEILLQFGVKQQQMHELEPTALYVDLCGQAAPSGQKRCIAFRADMDALSMIEANQHLQYRSKNHGKAHMCGHDGHMACLVGFVPLFQARVKQIPSDKVIRLLFQPSEQGPKSGAKKMIEDGCLQGVDEVYGFHQWPTAPLGQLWCKEGPVMSQITILKITIIGTSGHGSQPQKLKESVPAGVRFYQKAIDYLNKVKQQNPGEFVSTLPIFQGGQRYNVISQSVFISGTIRSFKQGLSETVVAKLTEYLEELKADGFDYIFDHQKNAPANVNTKEEAQHVLRVGKQLFGNDKVGKGKLPFRASEDFSFFTRQRPGAFFFFSTSEGENQPMVHNCNFNFNDKLIGMAAKFWLHLARDRLHLK